MISPSISRQWRSVSRRVLLCGDPRVISGWFRAAPTMSVASAQAASPTPRALRPSFVASAPSFESLAPARFASVSPALEGAALGKGLLGYWRFDEPYGSAAARDLSGNGNDCFLRRLDPQGPGPRAGSAGPSSSMARGGSNAPGSRRSSRMGSEMTISLWLRRLGNQQRVRALVTRQYGSADLDNFHFGLRDDELWMRTRFRGQATLAAFPHQRGSWHHLSVSLDAGGRTRLFIDGEEVMKRRRDGQPPLGGRQQPAHHRRAASMAPIRAWSTSSSRA